MTDRHEMQSDELDAALGGGQFEPDPADDMRPTRRGPGRQVTMLARHPEMDEHVMAVRGAVRNLASQMPEGTEVSIGVKIPFTIFTDDSVEMDAKLTVKLDAKPHVEKE